MWIIEKNEGVVYRGMTNALETETGDKIASIFINGKGNLEISLMMDTNFIADEGWSVVGFDGCENHIASSVWLQEGGGVLEYQEDRHSIFRKPGKKISVRVMQMAGDVIIPYKRIPTKHPFLYHISEVMDLVSSWWRRKKVLAE